MMVSPRMTAAMAAAGNKIKARYRALAPVRTGELRASARVSTEVNSASTPRRVAVIKVTADHAAALEFGAPKQGRRGGHYLRKALKG